MDLSTAQLRGYLESVRRRPIYISLSILIALLAVAGFLPDALFALVHGQLPPDAIIHVHVAIYSTWLVLFFVQTVLAAIGRVQAHRKLGKVLIGYGVLMMLVGWAVTINRFFDQAHLKRFDLAESTNLAPVVDMLAFPIFFGLAIYMVRKPEVHKRLMIVTATLLVYPAIARVSFPKHWNNSVVFLTVWSSPVLGAMAYDWHKRRLIHPAYLAGGVTMCVLVLRVKLLGSAIWLGICHWLESLT